MNILIIAGGTGSIQIQQGLFGLLNGLSGVKTQVLVNAYDNGLSTGAVRTVVNGKILGPSDVRKNQTTLLKLVDPKSPYHELLDVRFTISSADAKQFCMSHVDLLPTGINGEFNKVLLKEAIDVFFSQKLAMSIDYNDFALANIIYAGFAIANNNSLRTAASIMAGIMGLPKDCVILNDDRSMFLGAVTKSGVRLNDEGDIVKWGKIDDPIVDVFFTDSYGVPTNPVLCAEAEYAIKNADLIILSTGTQWSSLIPTYASAGFKEAIEQSPADIVMLMNRIPDKDSPGQTANEIVEAIVPRFFPEKRIKLIVDEDSPHPIMRAISDDVNERLLKSSRGYKLAIPGYANGRTMNVVHSPASTAMAILCEHFGDLTQSEAFVFDYDDTLVARGNTNPGDSARAIDQLLRLNVCGRGAEVYICTGNSVKAVNIVNSRGVGGIDPTTFLPVASDTLKVFADGGINLYALSCADAGDDDDAVRHVFKECVAPSRRLPEYGDQSCDAIIQRLLNIGIPRVKIENRGNAMITIRPVDSEYRSIIANYIRQHVIGGYESEHSIIVREAGRSTIEICHKDLSKRFAIHKLLESGATVTYVGDELYNGNDTPVREIAERDPRVKFINVRSIAHTAVFIMTVMLTKQRQHSNG